MELRLVATVLDTPAPEELAAFYERLLGWPRLMDEPDWIVLRVDAAHHALAFQRSPDFVAPVWPSEPGAPRMTMHIDFPVDDLGPAVDDALACRPGSRLRRRSTTSACSSIPTGICSA